MRMELRVDILCQGIDRLGLPKPGSLGALGEVCLLETEIDLLLIWAPPLKSYPP